MNDLIVLPITAEDIAAVSSITSVSKPDGFKSRTAARSYVKANGGRVVDNGKDASERWTVEAKATKATVTRPVPVAATSAVVTSAVKPGSKGDKKVVALALYAELETAGTLKRSTFLAEMGTRTGLSNKGASSYFYRIKGGKWA